MKILGEIALVTGASSGIGAATARKLAEKGAHVILMARRAEALEELASQIRMGGRKASPYPIDLSQTQAVAQTAQRIRHEIGAPAIIVNNAGMGVWRFIEETSPEQAVAMMALPYFAAFAVTRAFIPDMLRANRGHIVCVNSPASRFTWPGACAYTAARFALKGFTEALRSDLYRTGIRVTHFVAGHTATDYWKHNPGSEERVPKIAKLVPLLTPDEAAAALVRGIERDAREVVVPFMMRFFYWQHALFPRPVEWMLRATGYRRK